MGTASLTAALEVLWISNQTNINMFWRPFSLLYLSALRLTHTCLATTALATPAIPAMLVTDTRFPTLLPAMPVSLPLLFQPLPGPMRAPADTVQTPPAQSTVPKAQSFDPLHPGQNPLNQGSNTLFLELDNISVTNASK